MKYEVLVLFISIPLLCVGGCGGGDADIRVARPMNIPASGLMTLSQDQLASLDWHVSGRRRARVSRQRVVGSGVEFDISFPSNSPGDTALEFVSSGEGGKGSLAGGDTRGFKAFALKFTLVSINGRSDPDVEHKLVVGALIGPTARELSKYVPVTLSLLDSDKTATAKTPCRTDNIRSIGFHVHMLEPENWPQAETAVTLMVEPAEDAAPAPWLVDWAKKRQVKVIYLSDPPGGTLYKQNGDVWGPCPKALWYDLDEEAIERGYLDAKGLIVRWPSGPEQRSPDLIRIKVDGTDRKVTFTQPEEE